MNFVHVTGSIGLISLWISVITYFLSLILYIISFCLPDWIVYKSISIKIGIWRLCDTQVCFILSFDFVNEYITPVAKVFAQNVCSFFDHLEVT